MGKRNKTQEKVIGWAAFIICFIVYLMIQFGGCSKPLTREEESLRRAMGMDKKEFMKFRGTIDKEL